MSEYSSPRSDSNPYSHISELHSVFRKTAVLLIFSAALWSTASTSMINEWISSLSLSHPESGMAIYSPMDWIEVRWTLILLFSSLSVLPFFSILMYRFVSPGLYRDEKKWVSVVLISFSIIAPLATVAIWTWGISAFFSFSESLGPIDGVDERYDITQIISLSMGITWVVLICSITAISLSMSRLFLGPEEGSTRFRIRLLLISTGILVLTLPVIYDGLRIAIAVVAIFIADQSSRIVPIRR
jgi:Sec-independent protein secretion pathway component TatC